MNQEIIAQMAEIVEKNSVQGGKFSGQICVLSLIDSEGFPTSSVLTPSKSAGIKWLTFGTLLDANRAKRIAKCNRAAVCFGTTGYCINLVGEIEIITDADVKHDMWYDGLAGFFTGPDDPNYCVLKFITKRCKFFRTSDGLEVEGIL